MAKEFVASHKLNIRQACTAFGISQSCYRYQPKLSEENDLIAKWLIRLTSMKKNWGFAWNHKRVYRIYKELELNLRIKPKRRLKRATPDPLVVP